MQDFKRWIYHETKQPRIINNSEYEQYEPLGWADSPAQFIKIESLGIDKEDSEKAQQALDAVAGVVESLNGALNLGSMSKNELEDYAKEHFGVDIDRRKNIKALRAEVSRLSNDNSSANN